MDQKADKGFLAAYLKLSRQELKEKVLRAEEILKCCTLCPRACKVDRPQVKKGSVKQGTGPLSPVIIPISEKRPLLWAAGGRAPFFSRAATSDACSARTGPSATSGRAVRCHLIHWPI
jgi:uncharacterized Fe-S radical SAM superfamily protein PflX